MTIRNVILVQNHLEELGGITRFCALLGSGLSARGYRVEVGSISPPVNAERGAYPEAWPRWTLTQQLSPHVRTRAFSGKPLAGRALRSRVAAFNAEVAAAARERFAAIDADTAVIFTQLYARERVGAAAGVAARLGRYPLIAMYHNSFIGGASVGDTSRVLTSFSEADQFLSLTAEDARLFQQAGMNNSGFVQNPMLPMPEAPYPRDSRTVVSLGRYDAQKSLDHVIEAWALIGDDTAGWNLELFGEGPKRSELEQLIADLALTNVHLRGTTTDAMGEIARSAFTVQSSQYEGQPLALMESAALGIPCVAYNCAPGVAEIIEDGVNGYLAAPNDPYALSYGMRQLMASAETRERMGAAARAHVRTAFDLDAVLDRWEHLFAALEFGALPAAHRR